MRIADHYLYNHTNHFLIPFGFLHDQFTRSPWGNCCIKEYASQIVDISGELFEPTEGGVTWKDIKTTDIHEYILIKENYQIKLF